MDNHSPLADISPISMKTSAEDGPVPVKDNTQVVEKFVSGANGEVLLVPTPSDDPRDPLNWPMSKKALSTFALCFAMFTAYSAPFNGQIQLVQQAALYGKTTTQITYFNSAASGGLSCGCWFWWPLSKVFGKSAVIFWCLVGTLITQIWALYLRNPNDYDAFLAAKFFMGFFAQAPSITGPLYLVDLFFLHQRGRAFTLLGVAMNIGASAGPTFSGFITVHLPWYNEYWWTIGLSCLAMVVVFLFLEETTWNREDGAENITLEEYSWMKRRLKTFFPGTSVVKRPSRKEIIDSIVIPAKLAVNPVLLLVAGFDAISFGFWVALNALMPVWLQKPVKLGGYGFSVLDNAAFTTIHWINLIVSQIYGHFFSDRIPLWFCARNNGIWRPEFRLHSLWIPNFFLSTLGLGFVGIALQYQLHWMLLAVGNFLVTFGALQGIPVTMNYIAECFRKNTSEATIPLNSFRLFLGLTINFYINYWVEAVGLGWVYGMMAFFTLFSFTFLIVLMWKGHEIREASPFITSSSEEGEKLYRNNTETSIVG